MNIMVTGAGGFLGRNLVEHLVGKHNVIAIAHQQTELTDFKAVECLFCDNKIDLVLHTATVGGTIKGNCQSVVEQNLRMYTNLERCLTSNMRMISFGSGAEYARAHWSPAMSERDVERFVPSDDYGYSKQLINRLIRVSKKDVINLRIFGLFGKYEEYRFKFISNCIVKKLLGQSLVLNRNARYDYTYIDDFLQVVDSFMLAETKERDYNVCSGYPIELLEIARIIEQLDENVRPVEVIQPQLGNEYSGNNARMRQVHDREFMSMQDSVKLLYKYYENELKSIDVESITTDAFLKRCQNRQKEN